MTGEDFRARRYFANVLALQRIGVRIRDAFLTPHLSSSLCGMRATQSAPAYVTA